jgi:hypothetical protein
VAGEGNTSIAVLAFVVDTALLGIIVSELVLLLPYVGAVVVKRSAFVTYCMQ